MTKKELKQFRKSLKLSQSTFGYLLGFKNPQVSVSDLETGKRPINQRLETAILMWKKSAEVTGR